MSSSITWGYLVREREIIQRTPFDGTPTQVQDSPQAIFTSFKLEKNDSRSTATSDVQTSSVASSMVDTERNGVLEAGRNLCPPSGVVTVKNQAQQQYVPSGASYMGPNSGSAASHLGGLDSAAIFGNFSQLLERHMREVPQHVDSVPAEKARNHLKCVVCRNLFETFADIKNHACPGDRAALDKPLLAFPPSLAHHTGQSALDYRSPTFPGPPELDGSASPRIAAVPSLLTPAGPQQARDSVSLVKTAGTFFPDVNANKLKYA